MCIPCPVNNPQDAPTVSSLSAITTPLRVGGRKTLVSYAVPASGGDGTRAGTAESAVRICHLPAVVPAASLPTGTLWRGPITAGPATRDGASSIRNRDHLRTEEAPATGALFAARAPLSDGLRWSKTRTGRSRQLRTVSHLEADFPRNRPDHEVAPFHEKTSDYRLADGTVAKRSRRRCAAPRDAEVETARSRFS